MRLAGILLVSTTRFRDFDMLDVVGAGHRALHAVERTRHRRAQERAVVFELIELERQHAAVFGDGGFDFGDAVRPGACGDEVLDAVLDPFHRPPGDVGGKRHRARHRERPKA